MTQQQHHEDSSVYGLAADDGAAPPPLHPALAEEMARSGSQPRIEDLLCPYCQQPLVAGSKICVYCGSDVSQHLAKHKPAAVVRGRPAPVPAPTVGPPVTTAPAPAARQEPRATQDEPRRSRVGLIMLGIVLVVIGGVAIQGVRLIIRSRAASGSAQTVSAAPPINEADAAVLQQIKDEHGTEARAWLAANEQRSLMSLSHAQSVSRVEDLYRLGARQVIAFSSRISATVAVELPDDPAHRKALFDWADRWNREHRFESDRDTGQNWLVIRMPF